MSESLVGQLLRNMRHNNALNDGEHIALRAALDADIAEAEERGAARVRERVEAMLADHFAPSGMQWTEIRPESIRAALTDEAAR